MTSTRNASQLRQDLAERLGQVLASAEPERTLRLLVEVRDLTAWLTDLTAAEVKAQGYSWEHVGGLVGITKQGAQQRWG